MCPPSRAGPEWSRGVSLRIWLGQDKGSWAWRAWISISHDWGVFSAWARETTPCETGVWRKKSPLKKLKCQSFNFPAPVFFSPTQYLSGPLKRDCSRRTTPNSKCRHCAKRNKKKKAGTYSSFKLIALSRFSTEGADTGKTAPLRKIINRAVGEIHSATAEAEIGTSRAHRKVMFN